MTNVTLVTRLGLTIVELNAILEKLEYTAKVKILLLDNNLTSEKEFLYNNELITVAPVTQQEFENVTETLYISKAVLEDLNLPKYLEYNIVDVSENLEIYGIIRNNLDNAEQNFSSLATGSRSIAELGRVPNSLRRFLDIEDSFDIESDILKEEIYYMQHIDTPVFHLVIQYENASTINTVLFFKRLKSLTTHRSIENELHRSSTTGDWGAFRRIIKNYKGKVYLTVGIEVFSEGWNLVNSAMKQIRLEKMISR